MISERKEIEPQSHGAMEKKYRDRSITLPLTRKYNLAIVFIGEQGGGQKAKSLVLSKIDPPEYSLCRFYDGVNTQDLNILSPPFLLSASVSLWLTLSNFN